MLFAAHSLARAALLSVAILTPQLPAQDQKDKPAKARRAVGGPVALVHDGFSGALVECVVSADGSTTAVLTDDRHVYFFTVVDHFGDDLAKIGTTDTVFRYELRNCTLSANGDRLVGRINSSTLAIVTGEPRVLHHLRGMPGVVGAAFHPDGVQLAAGAVGGLVRIWDAKTGKSLMYLSLTDDGLTWFGFVRKGAALMTVAADKKLRIYSVPDAARLHERDLAQAVRHVSFTADREKFVVPAGKKVQIWSAGTAMVAKSFDTGKPVVRVEISADGKRVAVAHGDGTAALYDVGRGRRTAAFAAHRGQVIVCLRFIEQGGKHLLVTAARKGDVVYWDVGKLEGRSAGKSGNGAKARKKRRKRRHGR